MFTHSSKTNSTKTKALSVNKEKAQEVGAAPESLASPQNVIQLQRKIGNSAVLQLYKSQAPQPPTQHKNNSGLPDSLRARMENLSGMTMDDVKVHYNSDKPTQMGALAYTNGTDIHVAAGQEKHLPHEAWHVVQQKQGRVQPTTQFKFAGVNDNPELEKEADEMSGKAIQFKKGAPRQHPTGDRHAIPHPFMDLNTWIVTLKRDRIADLFRTLDGLDGHATQIQQEITRLVNVKEHFEQERYTYACQEIRNALYSAGEAATFDFPLTQFDFGDLGTLSLKRIAGTFSGNGGPQ